MSADGGYYQQVYKIVGAIPAGSVATYGQIALMTGRPRAARLVGNAVRTAPPGHGLPCHRVVNRTGSLAPGFVFGGQDRQRFLLESEGVTFLADGRIDMKKHIWTPSDGL